MPIPDVKLALSVNRQPTGARRVYDLIYGMLCGTHPSIRPWHFQWLATKDLYAELRRVLPTLEGRVLDVGCGRKPYRAWLTKTREYVGLDVTRESDADVVVTPGDAWPFGDMSFDALFSTQVLEHAGDFDNVLHEIDRVLKPGGVAVITVPFIFNEHGAPEDFRRFSAYGARQILPPDWEVRRVARLGGFGSAVGVLVLNWIDISTSLSWTTKIAKAVLLPVWIIFSAIVNAFGQLFDSIGERSAIYVNVLVIYAKPAQK